VKSDCLLCHVCLSAWNYSAPTGQIFMKFDIWAFLRKSVEKIQVSLKSDKKNGYFTWRQIYIFNHILIKSSHIEKFSGVVEKIKRHISCLVSFFFENCAVYEKIWNNIVKPGRPQMTVWCIHIACWIPIATNTHSKHVILNDFPLQQ